MNRFFKTDLRRSVRNSVLAFLILTLAFAGPVLTSLLRSSVEGFIRENSRQVLTADVALQAFRPLTEEELKRVTDKVPTLRQAKEIEFVSMLSANHSGPAGPSGPRAASSLIEVHAIEESFPLIGAFEALDSNQVVEVVKGSPPAGDVWLTQDARVALQLDGVSGPIEVQIGRTKFRVAKILSRAPGMGRSAFGFAPKAYIRYSDAEGTGLLGFGSQVQHRTYLEFAPPAAPTEDEIKTLLKDPDLFIRTPDDSLQGLDRFTQTVSLYLAVVSICLLSLGGVAAYYILRTQSLQRMRTAAIAMVYGAELRSLVASEFVRAALLSVFAMLGAMGSAWILSRALQPKLSELLSTQTQLSSSVATPFLVAFSSLDLVSFLVGALVIAIVFTIPFLDRIRTAQLKELFADSPVQASETQRESARGPWLSLIATGALALLILSGLAMLVTRDAKRGLQLALAIAGSVIVIDRLGYFIFSIVGRLGAKTQNLRLLSLQLSRARFATRLSFLSIGLSVLVSVSVGQIMMSLGAELKNTSRMEKTPDFFLFNIPDSDLESLKARVAKEKTTLEFVSPMILARLRQRNGTPLTEERFAKFPVRVTWRETLIGSETLQEGPPLKARFNPETEARPGVSVETRFAEQNGFRIGDRLEFDVQGVPIEAEIVNLRKVKWMDFNPNFFISFQGGVLDDAPKTWLANIRLPDRTQRAQFQASLVREFPDISILDVGATLDRVVGLIRAIVGPAEWASVVSAVFAILMLAAIVMHSTALRLREMNLFRILGAEPRRVRRLYRLEFLAAGAVGALLGGTLGCGLAALASIRFLDIPFHLDGPRLLLALLLASFSCLFLGDWLYRRVARGLGNGERVV